MNMSTHFLNQIGLKPNQVKRKQLTFMKKSAMALPRSLPRLLPIVAAVMLSACSTQPVYEVPKLDVPAQFKEATPQAAQFGVWQPAQTGFLR